MSTKDNPGIARTLFSYVFVLLAGAFFCTALLSITPALAFANDEDSLATGSSTQLSAESDDIIQVWVSANVDQSAGQSLLAKVNAERANNGLYGLAWDSSLERTAIQRAVEIALRYDSSHARPDGSSCFTAYPYCETYGENIAAGYGSADSVNRGWINSAPHHATMLRSDINCMAAACAVGENGRKYWVECFARRSYDGVTCGQVWTPYVYVNVRPSLVTLKLTGPESVSKGETVYCGARIGDVNVMACVEWQTSNSSIASLSPGSTPGNQIGVNGISSGTVTLSGKVWGGTAIAATKTITVNSYNLADATVTYEGYEYDYKSWVTNQYEHKLPYHKAATCPNTTVVCGGSTLVLNRDYTLSYRVDHANLLGIITVKGLGKYAGTSKTVTFGIIPVNMSWVGLSASYDSAYNGKPKKLNMSVTYSGTKFTEGVDYTVSYKNNINAGTANVTLVGKGLLKGTINGTFTIYKASNSMKVKAKKASVKYSKKKNRTIARNKYCTISKAKGKVKFAKVSGNKKIVVAKNGKITVKKKLKRGTYKIKVKITAAGNSNYKAKSINKTVKIIVK